ncbi:MAG TPA: YfiR family protein [Casimicrobiaceae bacterium]|nr:YfiR family protein [Casimicrobiaceae bacterium]
MEQRLKAVFLYKFADYVEWPERVFPRADTPVTIAVIGDEPLVAELTEVIKDRTLRGRSFEVRRLSDDSSVDGIHVLFVARAHDAALRRAAVASAPILVVTDSEGALNSGSTINFMVVDERVRFEVSVEDAERRGLKLSSRLLSVAQNVRTGKP